MTDKEILDWIEKYHCEVRHREYLPSGRRTKNVWWVAPMGKNPFIGKTIRETIKQYGRARN
jgi:hypothetical protein